MKKLVVVGGGGFAREVLWLIEEINRSHAETEQPYKVLGWICKSEEDHIAGLPVLGDDEWALTNLDKKTRFVLAIGDGGLRRQLAETYLEAGFKSLRIIHPAARMSDRVQLGPGTIVCAGAILTVDITIGNFSVVNLQSTVGHDCQIGHFVTVHPGANISGGVNIGNLSSVGSGAVILPGVQIGDDVQIGAGAVVNKNLESGKTYVGVPARELDQVS